jgi:hypothetical protein
VLVRIEHGLPMHPGSGIHQSLLRSALEVFHGSRDSVALPATCLHLPRRSMQLQTAIGERYLFLAAPGALFSLRPSLGVRSARFSRSARAARDARIRQGRRSLW